MAVKYEWKRTKIGKKLVRSVVPDEPTTERPGVLAPASDQPDASVPQTDVIDAGVEAEEPPKPKRGRPKKVVADE